MFCAASTRTCATGLRDEMTRAGVNLRFGVLPTRIASSADGLVVTFADGVTESFDQVLLATGRTPNTAGSASKPRA